jgi:hypothetical protein
MAGGSREPEGPDDYQCLNCGRWFHRVGLGPHAESCQHPDWADPLTEIVPTEEHPMMDADYELEDVDDSKLQEEDVVDEHQEEDVVDEAPAPTEPVAATDGGNPIFDSPEPVERATTDGGDPEDDPTCPECESNRYCLLDELVDDIPEEYDQFQFVCVDCEEVYGDS